jgi:hypothetical protein
MAVEWSAMNVGGEVEEEAAVEGEMNVPDTHPRHVFIALSRSLLLSLSSLSLGGGLPQFLLLHREHMTCVNHESKLVGWDCKTRVQDRRNSQKERSYWSIAKYYWSPFDKILFLI